MLYSYRYGPNDDDRCYVLALPFGAPLLSLAEPVPGASAHGEHVYALMPGERLIYRARPDGSRRWFALSAGASEEFPAVIEATESSPAGRYGYSGSGCWLAFPVTALAPWCDLSTEDIAAWTPPAARPVTSEVLAATFAPDRGTPLPVVILAVPNLVVSYHATRSETGRGPRRLAPSATVAVEAGAIRITGSPSRYYTTVSMSAPDANGPWCFVVARADQVQPSAAGLLAGMPVGWDAPFVRSAFRRPATGIPRADAKCARCSREVGADTFYNATGAVNADGSAYVPPNPGAHRGLREHRTEAPTPVLVCPDCAEYALTSCSECGGRVASHLAHTPQRLAGLSLGERYAPELLARGPHDTPLVCCPACRTTLPSCTDCGHAVVRAYRYFAPDDESRTFCYTCFEARYCYCHDCTNYVARGNAVTMSVVNGRSPETRSVCETCAPHYRACERCQNHFYYAPAPDRPHYYDDDENEYEDEDDTVVTASPRCPRCYPVPRVHDYSYRPDPVFYHTAADDRNGPQETRLYLGWELEVENRNDADRRSALSAIDAEWLYCKRDGSISHGFEIVSHPMTYDWMRQNREEFARRWRALVRMGFRSYDTSTCGLHVHMSRSAFTPLQLFRFQKLFYDHVAFATLISQRSESALNQWCSLTVDDGTPREKDAAMLRRARQKLCTGGTIEEYDFRARGRRERRVGPVRMADPEASVGTTNGHAGRYAAINCEPGHTVEIRLFRGTLNVESFFKAMQFCVAAFHFAREHTTADITDAKFVSYVAARRKEYPDLARFLSSREFGLYNTDITPRRVGAPEREHPTASEALAAAEASRLTRRLERARARDARQSKAAASTVTPSTPVASA
jgi:hypothetical protein